MGSLSDYIYCALMVCLRNTEKYRNTRVQNSLIKKDKNRKDIFRVPVVFFINGYHFLTLMVTIVESC